MKIGKTWLIVGIIAIAAVIMYFVYTQSKTTVTGKAGQVQVGTRAQELAAKLPYATRLKIIGVYDWYANNSAGNLEIRDGVVFDIKNNRPDKYRRTSIEKYLLDVALWDVATNYKLIDSSMEYYLKNIKPYTIAEFRESLEIQ